MWSQKPSKAVSEVINFKISWRSMPPDPPSLGTLPHIIISLSNKKILYKTLPNIYPVCMRKGIADQKVQLLAFVDPAKQFEAQFFFPILTIWLCVQFLQMPRSWDLVIFVCTADIQTDYFTCMLSLGTRKHHRDINFVLAHCTVEMHEMTCSTHGVCVLESSSSVDESKMDFVLANINVRIYWPFTISMH